MESESYRRKYQPQVPANSQPGIPFIVTYTVINLGPGEPWEPGWNDRVECFRVASPSTRVGITIGNSFRATVGLSYTRSPQFILPVSMAGTVRCTLTTNWGGQVRVHLVLEGSLASIIMFVHPVL